MRVVCSGREKVTWGQSAELGSLGCVHVVWVPLWRNSMLRANAFRGTDEGLDKCLYLDSFWRIFHVLESQLRSALCDPINEE